LSEVRDTPTSKVHQNALFPHISPHSEILHLPLTVTLCITCFLSELAQGQGMTENNSWCFDIRCVLSSVWSALTYHALICYLQCVLSCHPS